MFCGIGGTGASNAVLTLAQAGYALDLSKEKWANDIVPAGEKVHFFYNDQLAGIPLDLNSYAQIYNAKAFKADLSLQ